MNITFELDFCKVENPHHSNSLSSDVWLNAQRHHIHTVI